ncbi:MAG: hypothetical protein CME06_02230 [Gemmatimonadetes bacterium]|nr:hypothetical protein [Gemmatimonadota bacterium]
MDPRTDRSTRPFPLGCLTPLLVASAAFAYTGGSPAGFTGAPGEGTCVTCHSSYPVDSGDGGVDLIAAPDSYSPGQAYTFWVRAEDPGQEVWGFQLTAIDGAGEGAGTLDPGAPDSTQVMASGGREYVGQRTLGTWAGVPDGPVTWRIEWTAPASPGTGPVSFYFTGLGGDGNHIAVGDYIYTGSWTVSEGAGGGLDLTLDGVPATVSRGSTLTFTGIVTNTGDALAYFDEADLDATGPIPPTNVPVYDAPPRVPVFVGSPRSGPITVPVPGYAPLGIYYADVSISDLGVQLDVETITVEVTD